MSPPQARSEPGGNELEFYREASEYRSYGGALYKPAGGSLNTPFVWLQENTPTGPFRVRVVMDHSLSFDITASDLSVTNGAISGLTKITTGRAGWYFLVTPSTDASQVSVTIAEDAFIHNLKGNQSATKRWSVSDSDAPLVMAMVFTSANATRSGDGPYTTGEHIDLTLVYSEQVTVTHGTAKPYVTFDVNGVEKNAVYFDGSGTEMLRFRYAIESGFPSNGRAVPISASVNMPTGSAITETKSANPQDALTALPPAPTYMETPRPTTDTDVETPPVGAPGDTYQHRVRFNQAVKVRGTPGIALEFSLAGQTTQSKVVCSRYVRHISDTELLFSYVVPRNHGLNLALTHSIKSGMCVNDSSRITNASGTQDANHYLYSVWKRVVRIDVGDSKRLWFGLSGILPITVTIAFTNSHPSLITLGASSFTFTPQNALTPQGLTITTSENEQHRGQSAQVLYGIPEYSITGRDFVTIILEEEIDLFTTPLPLTAQTADRPDPPNLARNPVQWNPRGGMQVLPTRQSEVSANKPEGASGSLDLSAIAASVREQLRSRSRGFYLTTQIFGPADRPGQVRSVPGGGYAIFVDGVRYNMPEGGSLLLVRIWHIYQRPQTGINTIELLGDVFGGRPGDRLSQPVDVCLPAPAQDAERARLAVKGRLDSGWDILETRLEDGQVCAKTTRVAWFIIVLEPEPASEQEEV